MKNRYLRAAVWMLTVLMVLGCLPLLAAAEGTLTEVSGGTSALDAGIMPLAEDDTYTMTFYRNGGDGANEPEPFTMTLLYGEGLTFPYLPEDWQTWADKNNLEFAGWSTLASGTSTVTREGVYRPNNQWAESANTPVYVGKTVLSRRYVFGTGYVTTYVEDTVFYARWIDKESSGPETARFYIRKDGTMPFEPTNAQGSALSNLYVGPLSGTIKSPTPVNNNPSAVQANIAVAPDMDTIMNSCNADSTCVNTYGTLTKDETTGKYNFRVVWFVIKYYGGDLFTRAGWNVDGIIVPTNYHVIKYDPNKGTESPLSSTIEAGSKYEVLFDYTPVRAGYEFLGWSEDMNATDPTYTVDGNKTISSVDRDYTLYAVWKPIDGIAYTVEHYLQQPDGNYPTTASSKNTYYGTTTHEVTATVGNFEGYTFDEDNTNNIMTGVVAGDGSLVLKLYYTKDYGSMTISKSVSNANAAATFDVTVSGIDEGYSTFGGYTVTDGTVTIPVPKNGSVTLNNIPADTYTVAETSASSSGYTVSYEGLDGNGQVKVTKDNAPTVKVTNTLKVKNVTITKQVTGNFGDPNYDFQFTAIVKVGDEQVSIADADDYTVAEDGTVTFGLKNGESVTLKDVPTEAIVTVTETAVTGYTTQYMLGQDTYTGTSVSLNVAGDQIGVTFINDRTAQIDTGVDLDTIPYVVMLLSIFGAGALWLIGRRRRTQN